jgi:hypothetical protein
MAFKNGVNEIEAEAYNDARTVLALRGRYKPNCKFIKDFASLFQ